MRRDNTSRTNPNLALSAKAVQSSTFLHPRSLCYRLIVLLQIQELEPDKYSTCRLMSTEIQHTNEAPPRHCVHQSYRGDAEDRVHRPTIITLDEHTKEGKLVIFVLPLQYLSPERICER